MLVGTIYRIADGAAWRNALQGAEESGDLVPEGLSLLVSVHSAAGDYAFDLWDAASVDAVRQAIDPITEGLAVNTHFAVDPDHPATMLPAQS